MNKDKARELRSHPTDAERVLWRHIRLCQVGDYKFRHQQLLGAYIVDFVCLEKRLIIELDGGQHSAPYAYDSERSLWLESQGFRIFRFWDNQVFNEIDAVKEVIRGMLEGA